MKKVEIHWEIEDGYVGKSRPQTTKLTTDDFEGFEDLDSIKQEIESHVQEDFENTISFYISNLDYIAEKILEELTNEH